MQPAAPPHHRARSHAAAARAATMQRGCCRPVRDASRLQRVPGSCGWACRAQAAAMCGVDNPRASGGGDSAGAAAVTKQVHGAWSLMQADQGGGTPSPPHARACSVVAEWAALVHTRRTFAFSHTVSTRPWPPWPCPQPDRPSPLLQQQRRRGCGLDQCCHRQPVVTGVCPAASVTVHQPQPSAAAALRAA